MRAQASRTSGAVSSCIRTTSFPFPIVGNVLQHLDSNSPESAARRMMLLRRVVEAWRRSHFDDPHHERDDFVRLFGHFWTEFTGVVPALAPSHRICKEWPLIEWLLCTVNTFSIYPPQSRMLRSG